jgi:tellurite resistance protein
MATLLGLGCIIATLAFGVVLLRFLIHALQSAGKPAPRSQMFAPQLGVRRSSDVRYAVTVRVGGSSGARSQPDSARWVGMGETISVAGYTIPGGLLYIGRHLSPLGGYQDVEPALVNPDLPIDDAGCDWSGEQMPYWPSYSEVVPGCRAAYLRWLATGRKHPTVGIGYVFLFFYGLERRLLGDGARSALPAGESVTVVNEVERLRSLYGQQPSFSRYAVDFLAVARLQAGNHRASESSPPSIVGPFGEVPLAVRVGLGEFSAMGQPIPSAWALAWLRAHPETHLRTPAQRCASEFEDLFFRRYRDQFGEGMIVKPNKTWLKATYRPASASFGEALTVPIGDLPDVTVLTAPVRKLQDLAANCTDDLDAYSRLVGRDPAARDSLAGIALLPAELAAQHQGAEATRLSEGVEEAMGGGDTVTLDGARLLRLWSVGAQDKLSRSDAVLLAQFLHKRGFGLEPDVRFGGAPLRAETKAVVFRLPAEAPSTPSAPYHAAAVLLHLAAVVAQADGSLHDAEERHIVGHLQEALHLERPERLRLAAHLRWVLANPVGLGGLKKRLAHLGDAQRQAVAQFLVSVAAADGRVEPAEVETLTKIYSLLGLETARVYTDLHELGLSDADAGPVTVRPAAAGQPGYRIPPPPGSRVSAVVLDAERIHARMAETAAVAALLRDVFVEEEPAPGTTSATGRADLDEAHSEFLRTLATRPSWPRADLEVGAARLRLMLDGALELVNDRAFDVCGQLACEGEDPVEMNPAVVKELLA